MEQKGNALPFYLRKRGRADSVALSVLRDLGSLRAYGLAARGGACMRGQAPSNSPKGSGSGFGTPLRGGRRKPRADNPRINLRPDTGKERVDGAERPSTLVQV